MCRIRYRVQSITWRASQPDPSCAAEVLLAADTNTFSIFPSHGFGNFCRDFSWLFARKIWFEKIILVKKCAVIQKHNQIRLPLNNHREIGMRDEQMVANAQHGAAHIV